MATFDVALGVSAPALNAASAVLYQRLYPGPFRGSQPVSHDHLTVQVGWDIKSAPVLTLAPGGGPPVAQFDLAQVAVSLDGSPAETVAIQVLLHVEAAGGKLTLDPFKATASGGQAVDDWVLDHVLLPQALVLVRGLLAGIALPPLDFGGLELGPLAVAIEPGWLVAGASLAGRPSADLSGGGWPTGAPFFALLSKAAVQALATHAAGGFSYTFTHSGSLSIGIGKVSYDASLTVDDLQLASQGGPKLAFTVADSGSAEGKVKVVFVKKSISFDIEGDPDPSGTVTLSASGSEITATTDDVSPGGIRLEPKGSFWEKLLDELLSPLTSKLWDAFGPRIASQLRGITLPLWRLPSIPIHIPPVDLEVRVSQLGLASDGDLLQVQGQVAVS